MKKINNILFLIFVALTVTSCLKDDRVDSMEYGIRIQDLEVNKIIEFPIISHAKSLPILIEGDEATVEIGEINLAAKDVAQEDVVINLKLITDENIIKSDAMNLHGMSEDEVLFFPSSAVTIPSTITIPKGESKAKVIAKVKTSALKAESAFIKLIAESVQQEGYMISGNFGSLLLDFKIRSKYEGTYKYECIELGPWPHYFGYIDQGAEIYLSTISPDKVKTTNGAFHLFRADVLAYQFDQATNKIVNIEYLAWGSANPITILESSYDAASKTNIVKYRLAVSTKPIVEKFTRVD